MQVRSGVDSGIVDPLVIRLDRIAGLELDSWPFRLAAAVLAGADAFAIDYISVFRAGELAIA